jgi:hypothetical protein
MENHLEFYANVKNARDRAINGDYDSAGKFSIKFLKDYANFSWFFLDYRDILREFIGNTQTISRK